MSKLEAHVTEDSRSLLLLQTRGVLTRPWCILELYRAIEASVPIVGVSVRGQHAYDFAEASQFLLHLDSALEDANPGATELLKEHGVDLEDAAYKLHRYVGLLTIEYRGGLLSAWCALLRLALCSCPTTTATI